MINNNENKMLDFVKNNLTEIQYGYQIGFLDNDVENEKKQISGDDVSPPLPFAKAFPISKSEEPDSIENSTVKIFIHLLEITDRIAREEIEKIVSPIPDEPFSPKKHSHSYTSYRSDSNFLASEFGFPVHTPNVVQNMIASFTELFWGWRPIDKKKQKNIYQLVKMLEEDKKYWNDHVKNYYSKNFRLRMDKNFKNADKLLAERKEDANRAFLYRIAFYAGVIISAVGYCISRKVLTGLGVVSSGIAFSFMIKNHIDLSFRQMQRESVLKTNVSNCYFEAGSYRLNIE